MAHTENRGGARLAPRPAKNTAPMGAASIVKKVLFILYIILVVISAFIVGAYLLFNLMVKPPEIPQTPPDASVQPPAISAPVVSTPAASTQEPDEPVEPTPQRRDGVYTFVLLGKDRESGCTDTIIMVTYDTVEQKIGMVSVPRDTIVRRSWSKNHKINTAYAMQGPETLKAELENTFGIPIDYYVWINLNGFIALVNELGGVEVYIPETMNYDDPYQDLHIHYEKGYHYLNGQQAMEVVRFRKNNPDENGVSTGYTDEGRAAMQRQVLVNLAKKALSWNSLTKIQNFVNIFQTYVKTDLPADDMLWFATKAMSMDLSTGLQQGALEGRSDSNYYGESWCYTYKAEDILPTLNGLLNPYDMDLTADDLDLLQASSYYFKEG